jgi:hypothetical protein
MNIPMLFQESLRLRVLVSQRSGAVLFCLFVYIVANFFLFIVVAAILLE